MIMNFLRVIVGVGLLMLVTTLTACGKKTAVPDAQPVRASAAAPIQQTLPVLRAAPDFKLRGLDGSEVSRESLKGKVVVVDFWATWCPPCIEEIPGYIALQDKHGKSGLVIVGVSLDRKGPAHVQKFADKNKINYVLAMGDDALAEAFGGIEAIPTTFLIDRNGQIRHKKVGAMAHEEYEKLLLPLL